MTQSRITQLIDVWNSYKKKDEPTEVHRKILADSVGFLLKELQRLSLNQYQALSRETVIYPEGQAIIYCALKLASEAGEVAGKVGKVLRDDAGSFSDDKKQELYYELGDVLWYVAALSHELGFTLEDVAQGNLDKLSKRKEKGTLKGSGDKR